METEQIHFRLFQLFNALILPTRDGNDRRAPASFINLIRFDPTYKGWKLKLLFIKNTQSCLLWSYLQGMETLFQYPQPVPLFQALILPTRDGNSTILFLASSICSSLWSYLQGMETNIAKHHSGNMTRLWSYLQGMETVLGKWKLFLWIALILPTRDGNFVGIEQSGFVTAELWSYLQGMETFFFPSYSTS